MRKIEWALVLVISFVPGATVLYVASCVPALQPAVVKDLLHARTLSGMAYQHVDAATPAGAEIRGTYCAVTATLQQYNIDGGTDDSGITCKR